ncbi:hypothetical protein NGRA_2207 [Nosema granulosis]|uniref:GLTSCR protein conserved domain-containing protein n=1 Tax=Nosema granulosis TaxID=83296 RepID=A0A9P6GXF8_9MICR|nr:hypothetical protein NGRA_2207 [Nosema granulosis]
MENLHSTTTNDENHTESLNEELGYNMQFDKPVYNPYINKLGDSREFGNFYDVVQERKERILSFLQKDILQISNPDLRPFNNPQHAYECLIPYHLFRKGLYEDQIFLNTNIVPDLRDSYTDCLRAFDEIVEIYNRPLVKEHGVVTELLLFYEQRYVKGCQSKEKVVIKKKNLLNKRNTVIRLRVEDRGCKNGVRISNYKFYFSKPKEVAI